MTTSETRNHGRLRGDVLTAVASVPVGVGGTWWVHAHTEISAGAWATVLIAGLVLVLLLSGLQVVKR